MNLWVERFQLTKELAQVVEESPSITVPEREEELYELIFGGPDAGQVEVGYEVEGRYVLEATVVRCRNGAVVNYMEPYMRRRDPDSMRIADGRPTDKPRFEDVYGYPFDVVRRETMDWLAGQELILLPFLAGGRAGGYPALLVCPKNAAFFAFSLALLQGFYSLGKGERFAPRCVIYVAPPFRHTHFGGRQVVVHSRGDTLHEIFSYNLYPGPSAKKGVYSFLLDVGEQEGWVTAHASAARIITPYENELVMMHEGASGGGKSELLEDVARDPDGQVLLGENTLNGNRYYLHMSDTCTIEPVVDDMALCLPALRTGSGKMAVTDGEEGWFVRVDAVTEYGSDPVYERLSIHTDEPLVFMNLQAVPGSTCLLWDHIRDHMADGSDTPCPNPRVIIPRRKIPRIVEGAVEVDVRGFGVRMPPATAERPSCGIVGLFQVLPPALAWLWRLVAPRGYHNPSITSGDGMESEGVGAYWPFATGVRVRQANLLLGQILDCPATRYVLIPNQYIGVYRVGFAAEWITREYLARRGGTSFRPERLVPARCPLLGYGLREMRVDGEQIPPKFLRPELQERLGPEGYDVGAEQLTDFFRQELAAYDRPELHPVGRAILDCFAQGGTVEDYEAIIPMARE